MRMKHRHWPTHWPSTSSRRWTTCRKRRRRSNFSVPLPALRGEGKSIHIFLENRLDRAVPLAVEFLQQFLGRRDAARDRFLERAQVARFVAAIAIEISAPRQPARGKPQGLLRQ